MSNTKLKKETTATYLHSYHISRIIPSNQTDSLRQKTKLAIFPAVDGTLRLELCVFPILSSIGFWLPFGFHL